jgi:hypothetical protein
MPRSAIRLTAEQLKTNHRISSLTYARNNPIKTQAYQTEYYKKNRELILTKRKEKRALNKLKKQSIVEES